MLKDMFDKGKCLVGLHQGEWEYDTAGTCAQTRICERCGAESTRVAHSWAEWEYDAPASCAITHVCTRCGETEHDVVHDWGEPYYAYADSCEQVQVCARCGEEHTGEEVHQWGEWEYLPDACVQVQTCVRCGQRNPQGRIAHHWGHWEYSEAHHGPIRACEQCGEVVDRETYSQVKHAPVEVPTEPAPQISSSPATVDLVQRRQAIMERFWDVEDAAPSLDAPEVLDAAAVAVNDLQDLLDVWDAGAEGALETGKTFRFLGDLYFSLSGKEDREALRQARDAYLQAETWVGQAHDRLELAKLNFNLANTLRLVDGWQNRELLEEAKHRYYTALTIFREEMPDAVPRVESSIQSLEVMLRTLSAYEEAEQSYQLAEDIKQRLEAADEDDDEALREISDDFDAMMADEPAPEDQLQDFMYFFEQASPLLAQDDPESEARYAEMRDELAELSESFSEDDEDATSTDALFKQIYTALEDAGESGDVDAARQASLFAMLKQFEGYAKQDPQSPEDMFARIGKMRDLIAENKHIFTQPKVTSGRAGVVAALFASLRGYLMDQMNQSHLTETESEIVFNLFLDSGHIRKALADAGDDDAAVLEIEHDRLRPLAHRARRFGLRRHLMVATPLWGWPDVETNPNHVFFAGSDALKQQVARSCAERQLELAEDVVGWGAGQVRWNQLRESSIGIFDLTMESKPARARVCHALGSALTLGVYPVVVVNAGDTYLPFDIDMPPVRIGAESDTDAVLGAAIDRALFGTYTTAGVSSVDATVQRVLPLVGDGDVTSRVLKDRLSEDARLDPIDAKQILKQLLQLNAPGKTALLQPIWPAFYPDEDASRCFHVMPFSEPWSNDAREWARAACTDAGVRYRRGDETEEIQIIHSIWEEICRATHVVVDLTALNLNVCLELAMAQALGRPTLLLAQDDGTVDKLFPEIAKLQVRQYPANDGKAALQQYVTSFVTA